jgi:hypothetical protein
MVLPAANHLQRTSHYFMSEQSQHNNVGPMQKNSRECQPLFFTTG